MYCTSGNICTRLYLALFVVCLKRTNQFMVLNHSWLVAVDDHFKYHNLYLTVLTACNYCTQSVDKVLGAEQHKGLVTNTAISLAITCYEHCNYNFYKSSNLDSSQFFHVGNPLF